MERFNMAKLTPEQALLLIQEHGSAYAAAKYYGCDHKTILHYARKVGKEEKQTNIMPRNKIKKIEDFRRLYDKDLIVPEKIKAAIKKLGVDGWEYEKDFVRMAGVRTADLAEYRDQFADYWITITKDSRRVWGGSVDLIIQLAEMI
jgi:hypothetical protein